MRSGAAGLALAAAIVATSVHAQGDPRRGEYLARAGGCVGCHTAEAEGAVAYAGGRALKTPFGTFYGPNITPHPQAGIGRWSEGDFIRAMRHGVRPDGSDYYPAFPYTSFTGISDADLRDLWAYFRSLPASERANQPHELGIPYRWRFLLTPWKWLFFTPGPLQPDPAANAAVNRGRYLTEALGHCGECHTPRNGLGALERNRAFAGGTSPEGKRSPNLTPARLKSWSDAELREFLVSGLTPDGDSASKSMAEVVRNTTSKLTAADLAAMIAYLRSLPPIAEEPRSK